MKLEHTVSAAAPAEAAWKFLDDNHRLTSTASGRDRRGSGTARADARVRLIAQNRETTMNVVSDLHLTGRIASPGWGVQDVSNKLFAEFADQVAARVGGGWGVNSSR